MHFAAKYYIRNIQSIISCTLASEFRKNLAKQINLLKPPYSPKLLREKYITKVNNESKVIRFSAYLLFYSGLTSQAGSYETTSMSFDIAVGS